MNNDYSKKSNESTPVELSEDTLKEVSGGFGPEVLNKFCKICIHYDSSNCTCSCGNDKLGLCEQYVARQ